jgi:hypothetical protein
MRRNLPHLLSPLHPAYALRHLPPPDTASRSNRAVQRGGPQHCGARRHASYRPIAMHHPPTSPLNQAASRALPRDFAQDLSAETLRRNSPPKLCNQTCLEIIVVFEIGVGM